MKAKEDKIKYTTASKLYDYTQCPHRVWRDVYGPQNEKIKETNPFVQLLWERGIAHEESVVSRLGEFLDMRPDTYEERFKRTIEAMQKEAPLINQGVLICENMFGIPDLLKRLDDCLYVPIEIKSGRGFEGVDEEKGDAGKPKKHYAVQLALYSDLLNKLGFEKIAIALVGLECNRLIAVFHRFAILTHGGEGPGHNHRSLRISWV